MSDSVRPHRWQPTRFPRPWDSPGKNTGVGCHFLLQCMKVKSESEVAQSFPTLHDPMDCMQPTRLLCLWDFPGKSTGVGCHCLLQLIPALPLNDCGQEPMNKGFLFLSWAGSYRDSLYIHRGWVTIISACSVVSDSL